MNDKIIDKVGKRLNDLSDLPDELKKQLQMTRTDELEDQIISIIDGYEGFANIDEILVGLYREFGKIHERNFISNKLYRMKLSGLVQSVEKKKGVYKTQLQF